MGISKNFLNGQFNRRRLKFAPGSISSADIMIILAYYKSLGPRAKTPEAILKSNIN